MTTHLYQGTDTPGRLSCPITTTSIYPTLVLALRDFRQVNGRNVTTGSGVPNDHWPALSLGMTILDTLTGNDTTVKVGVRWERLLTAHGLTKVDAEIVYKLRCSLLHGYGLPEKAPLKRSMLLTNDLHAPALDTDKPGQAVLSVPVFCAHLVEKIAFDGRDDWDVSEINTDYPYIR